MKSKSYAVKSSARRAAKTAGLNPDAVIYGQDADGQWYYEVEAVTETPVVEVTKVEETFEEGPVRKEMTFTEAGDNISVDDKALMDRCGHVNCPHCSIHLTNGIGEHGQDVNGKPIKHEKFFFACLACGGEFGPEITKAPVKTKTDGFLTEPVKQSTIQKPCSVVWDIAIKMDGARRKDVIQACVDAGVSYYTARTQYQQWYTAKNNQTKSQPQK